MRGNALIKLMQQADNPGVTGRRLGCFFRQCDQFARLKTGAQGLQPQRRQLPIAITARPPQQIYLPVKAGEKCPAQLFIQRCVVARSRPSQFPRPS